MCYSTRFPLALLLAALTNHWTALAAEQARPNVILCMADDQGWGDVAYNGHPALKTPSLDAMASSGLRFDRFYSASSVCSPTRGSVLTGRHPNRFGCFSWGHTLRPEEITLAEALRDAGYATGHFGKWHLGPVRKESSICPGNSGFEEWFSSPNFFDNSPMMSRRGEVVRTEGEGSQVAVDAALDFIRAARRNDKPFLAVIWFGSPHLPHQALDEDRKPYANEPENVQHYLGEIAALDRAMGNLRRELRTLGAAENTLLWYTSDNGPLPPGSSSGLRGRKAELWEGGVRVPAIVEWPARIKSPRSTELPCSSVDIYPTLLELAGASPNKQPPLDGVSLRPLFDGAMFERPRSLGFWDYPTKGLSVRSARILAQIKDRAAGKPLEAPVEYDMELKRPYAQYSEADVPGHAAWMEGNYKLHRIPSDESDFKYSLYDLATDREETKDLAADQPERVKRMRQALADWQRSIIRSLNGEDY